jgi:hypothetical protein
MDDPALSGEVLDQTQAWLEAQAKVIGRAIQRPGRPRAQTRQQMMPRWVFKSDFEEASSVNLGSSEPAFLAIFIGERMIRFRPTPAFRPLEPNARQGSERRHSN